MAQLQHVVDRTRSTKSKKQRHKPRVVAATTNKTPSVFTPDGGGYVIGQIANSLGKTTKQGTTTTRLFGSVSSSLSSTCKSRPVFVQQYMRVTKHDMPKENPSTDSKSQKPPISDHGTLVSSTARKPAAKVDQPKRKEWHQLDPGEEQRTVFVGNLPIGYEKKKLQKLFSKFGEICSIRFRSVAPSNPDLSKRVIAHTKQFHTDRNSMNGYIVFKNEESAQKALKRNGQAVDSHHIRVDLASNSNKHDTKRSVFLGNLPFDVTDDVVREHFQECGRVENVRVIRDSNTGLGKGFGYLVFAEEASVGLALKLGGSVMAGRKVRVLRATKGKQIATKGVTRLNPKDSTKTGRTGPSYRGKPGQDKPGARKVKGADKVRGPGIKPRAGPRQSKSRQMKSREKDVGKKEHGKKGTRSTIGTKRKKH